jgi:hypothetical protein
MAGLVFVSWIQIKLQDFDCLLKRVVPESVVKNM